MLEVKKEWKHEQRNSLVLVVRLIAMMKDKRFPLTCAKSMIAWSYKIMYMYEIIDTIDACMSAD